MPKDDLKNALKKLADSKKGFRELQKKKEELEKKRQTALLRQRAQRQKIIDAKRGIKNSPKAVNPNKPSTWPEAPKSPIALKRVSNVSANNEIKPSTSYLLPKVPTHKIVIKKGPKGGQGNGSR